jgi:integrase
MDQASDVWNRISKITIEQAANSFVNTLSFHTRRNYITSFNKIFYIMSVGGTNIREMSIMDFSLMNLEAILDYIRDKLPGSVATKQNRCSCFISFTRYLERMSCGNFRMVKTQKGANATFKKIREKAATKACTFQQWNQFIAELRKISIRDWLIAKAIFQGAKRINEVLRSRIENIDWEKNRITYKQSKSDHLEKTTVITYPQEFMTDLKFYLNGRTEGYIFITRNDLPVTQPQAYRSFAYASVKAGLPFNIHPHMLRATAITQFFGMGYHSDDIMKVSGHATNATVLYYDKSKIEENLTTQVKLV